MFLKLCLIALSQIARRGRGETGLQAPKAQQKPQTPRANPGKGSRFAQTRWRGKVLCLSPPGATPGLTNVPCATWVAPECQSLGKGKGQKMYLWANLLTIILQGQRLLRTRGQDLGYGLALLPVSCCPFCTAFPHSPSWKAGGSVSEEHTENRPSCGQRGSQSPPLGRGASPRQ